MNRLLVDYFAYSVRLDEKSQIQFCGTLNLDYVCNLMGIPSSEFSSCGKVKYYKERYECNGVSVSVPFEHNQNRQGYFISMSGFGCRYFESNLMQDESILCMDIWRNFFCKIRALTACGLSINITRMDIANDDFSGLLDVDRIANCVRRDEVASRFQSREVREGKTDVYQIGETSIIERFYRRVRGASVNFGSRSSRSYCRIYDKKAEQIQRNYADKEKVKELQAIPHWVRIEFEFKDEVAVKMVNAFCDEDNFSLFYAGYVNSMLRFYNRDDSNVSRCTTQQWWLDFVGTAEKVKLSVGDYKPVSCKKHVEYVVTKLSGAIYAAMDIMGVDELLSTIVSRVNSHGLKSKHMKLCKGIEYNLKDLCSAELWQALKPRYRDYEPKRGEYWYSEKEPNLTSFDILQGVQQRI